MKYLKLWALGTLLSACGPDVSHSQLHIARPQEPAAEEEKLGEFVVALENKGSAFCTGVLVTPDTVLTAAHCFLREKSLADLNARIGTKDYAVRAWRTLADTDGLVSDDYLPNYDVAVVDIENVESSPTPFPRLMTGAEASRIVKQEALLAGFGMTAPGEGDMGTLRFGRTLIKSAHTTGRYTGLLIVDSGWQSGPCSGDSGGPLFVRYQNEWLVAGLVHGVNWYANPDFFGDNPCAFHEATYTMPGVFISSLHLAEEGRVQLIDPLETPISHHDWVDLCENQPLSREDLPTFKLLTLKFRFKSCAEIHQALLHKPIALDYGTSALRSVRLLSRIPRVSTLKADLSRLEKPDSALPHLEEVIATVSSQEQLDFLLGAQGLKKLHLTQTQGPVLDYSRLAAQTGILELRLNGMQLSKLPDLSKLKNLQHLELSLNSLENLDFLRGTKNLQYLNVSSNQIINIAGLVDSHKLEVLILSNNRIHDISALHELPAMQQLSLVNNPISRKICPYFEEQEGDICAF